MIPGVDIGGGLVSLSTRGTGAGIPTLGRPAASGATPASILAAAAMPASRFRKRRLVSYLQRRHELVEPLPPQGNSSPGALVDAKLRDAFGRVDDRDGRIRGPTKRPLGAKRDQDRLRQRDLPAQRRVHRVLKELVVQQTVTADRMKVGLPVNQDAAMSRGHVTVDLLERAGATHRHAVQVSGRHVFPIGFVPVARLLEELAQSVMRFREARLAGDQRAIALRSRPLDRRLRSLRAARNSRANTSRIVSRRRRGQERSVRFKARVVCRRQDQDR